MNGKGDTPRPMSVKKQDFDNSWDRIFGKKEQMCEYSGLPNTETYDVTSERSEDNQREFPRIDEDGVPIEWTAC